MPRQGRHVAGVVAALLFLVGVVGTSSASAQPATAAMTCAHSTDGAAAQLRILTLDQQRAYLATCGLPFTTHPACFGLSFGTAQASGAKPCATCHTRPSHIVFRYSRS
jgi:hypothetical protein